MSSTEGVGALNYASRDFMDNGNSHPDGIQEVNDDEENEDAKENEANDDKN